VLFRSAESGIQTDQLATIAASVQEELKRAQQAPKKTGIKAKAIMESSGSAYDSSVLAFDVGDIIFVEDKNASGIWKGTLEKNGMSGEFKSNYVEIIEESADADHNEVKMEPPRPSFNSKRSMDSTFSPNALPDNALVPSGIMGVSFDVRTYSQLTKKHRDLVSEKKGPLLIFLFSLRGDGKIKKKSKLFLFPSSRIKSNRRNVS